jgi:hypothetical protein
MNLSKQQRQWLSFKKFTSKEPTHLPLMILLSIENDGTVPEESLLPYCVRGMTKMFGEWYQKTNRTENTNKLN